MHMLVSAVSGWGKGWLAHALAEKNINGDTYDRVVVLDTSDEFRGLVSKETGPGLASHWFAGPRERDHFNPDVWGDMIDRNEALVVGRHVDAAHVTSVQERVREHDLADRVQFAGRLPDGELAKTLRSSHVLAVPSRYEGFGIVYLEGMSFGLPALATRAGGATDIVTDGETGVLVDPDDSAAVAHELERFATDRDRLAEMGWAARRNYETHPDWEETVGRVRDLLSDIVQPTEVPA